jgi:HK97 gp10 family phage protein
MMARLLEIKGGMGKACAETLDDVAHKIRDSARRIVPKDTGSLMHSIRVQKYSPEAGNVAKIGVSAGGYITNPKTGKIVDYARYVEFGTSKMPERPYMRTALYMHLGEIPINVVDKILRK